MKFLPEPFPSLGPNVNLAMSSIGANSSVPRGRTDTNWQLVGAMAHTHGRHQLKWGYEFRRTFVSQFFDAGFRGQLSFCTFEDFLQGFNLCGGQHPGSGKRVLRGGWGLYYDLFSLRLSLVHSPGPASSFTSAYNFAGPDPISLSY